MNNTLYWIAVAAVTILSSARLTRLAVYDDFPPVEWVRRKYERATFDTGWALLAKCGFCASFWITLVVVLAGYFSHVYGAGDQPLGGGAPRFFAFLVWWLLNGTLAASYLAASYVARDGDES